MAQGTGEQDRRRFDAGASGKPRQPASSYRQASALPGTQLRFSSLGHLPHSRFVTIQPAVHVQQLTRRDFCTLHNLPLAIPLSYCEPYKSHNNSTSHLSAHTTIMSLCINRLQEERKQWRKDHPFGFYAKPARGANGVTDLKMWEVGIPGRSGTIWAGGLFKLTMTFPDEYPTKPPKCKQFQNEVLIGC